MGRIDYRQTHDADNDVADDCRRRRTTTTTRQRDSGPNPKSTWRGASLPRRHSPRRHPPTLLRCSMNGYFLPPLHPQPQRASQARQARHPIDGIMGAACRWWLTPAPLRSRTRCRSHDDLRVPSRRNVGSGCRRLAGCPTHQATSSAGGPGGRGV